MPNFIEVPQGCYAEITRNTPADVQGLCTFGMGPCCHVIISNPNTGYMALCHADKQQILLILVMVFRLG